MRKVSNYSRKIEKFLDKCFHLYKSGYLRALNFETEGKRFIGQDLKDVSFEKGVLKFSVDKENFTVNLSEITQVKRLRTKKYLFTFEKAAKPTKKETTKKVEEKEVEKKPAKKKAAKKKTIKENKE